MPRPTGICCPFNFQHYPFGALPTPLGGWIYLPQISQIFTDFFWGGRRPLNAICRTLIFSAHMRNGCVRCCMESGQSGGLKAQQDRSPGQRPG